jgi:LysR family transcriptional regulator, chromosome initiation inhibitor
MKDLDPAALDCLAALVDGGSFERAAQQLSVTQSAISQRLRTLEAQIGQPLVVRARPLRLTDVGKVLLRYARQVHALRVDLARELELDALGNDRLPIAVNADSLATWVLPALDAVVQQGASLELLVDDQDFTHDRLREGAVLGCVSTVREPLRGCRVTPLGVMRYGAVASPSFVQQHLPEGLNRGHLSQLPFLVFNRKDDMQQQWVAQAFGVRSPRLRERFVPSSEAYVQAASRGWGVGVVPLLQVRPLLTEGRLVQLLPQCSLPVALFWHQWKLGPDGDAPTARVALLDAVGAALELGAHEALEQPIRPRRSPASRPKDQKKS